MTAIRTSVSRCVDDGEEGEHPFVFPFVEVLWYVDMGNRKRREVCSEYLVERFGHP